MMQMSISDLNKIWFNDVSYKEIYSKKAQKLIAKLLDRNPKSRIGGSQGAIEIMQDPFFKGINWDLLKNKKVKPPFKPKLLRETWVKYFSQEFIEEEAEDSDVESNLTLIQKTENHIPAFTYGNGNKILENERDLRETIGDLHNTNSMTNDMIIEMNSSQEQEQEQ